MDLKTVLSFLVFFSTISFSGVLADGCELPDCFSSGTAIPGGLLPSETPQMVILNFHSSIAAHYYDNYSKLLQGRKNPNGCNIRATFFVSHDYTDYPSVNALAAAGHEIGVNTITSKLPSGIDGWINETSGMREILTKFGLINEENILGSQGPYLQNGYDSMFAALLETGFKYDSTDTIQFSRSKSPNWPYTLDSEFPGLWELPIITLHADLTNCATLRSCPGVETAEDALRILRDNFWHHYNSTRAPFNVIIDPSWWGFSLYADALTAFLDYVQTLEDVYVVTANQTLEWVRNPTPLNNLSTLEPWKCDQLPAVGDCSTTYNCHYSPTPTPDIQHRYVNFCAPCPPNYPWVGNPDGN